MTNTIYCIVVAICFAIWSILLKKTGNPNMEFGTIIVMLTTLLPPLIYLMITSPAKLHMPWKHVVLSGLVGLINGLGMVFYMRLINTPTPALYVSTIAVLMPACAMILGYFILGQPTITLTKMAGIALAVVGVWLITK